MEGRISVVETTPSSNSINVPTNSAVTITFDKDISKKTLAGNIALIDHKGEKIDCTISSANKIVTVTPRQLLPTASSITVIVRGNNDPNNNYISKGICSPLGDFMLGDYRFSFSTLSAVKETEFITDMAPDSIALSEQPLFKGDVTNDTISVTKFIDIEISQSNTFESALQVWSGRCSLEDFKKGVAANKYLVDGSYYWRARCISEVNGEWSRGCTFAIDTHANSVVVADDSIDVDVAFPKTWDMLDAKVESTYPQDGRSNVPTNLKTITITLDQIVPEEELQYAALSLIGEDVDGGTNEDHIVDAEVSVVYDHENEKTIIIVALPIYEEEIINE